LILPPEIEPQAGSNNNEASLGQTISVINKD
jgi:hypothetical protein